MTTLTQAQEALKSISHGGKIKKFSNNNDFLIYGNISFISFKSLQSFNTVFDVMNVREDAGSLVVHVRYPKESDSLG